VSDDADGLAFRDGVGWVEDDLIAGIQASGDFEHSAVVLGDGDGLQAYAAAAYDSDTKAFGAEEKSGCRNG
jgi:hypothetical protein